MGLHGLFPSVIPVTHSDHTLSFSPPKYTKCLCSECILCLNVVSFLPGFSAMILPPLPSTSLPTSSPQECHLLNVIHHCLWALQHCLLTQLSIRPSVHHSFTHLSIHPTNQPANYSFIQPPAS